MLDHARKISRAFDHAANSYDEHAELQMTVGKNLISYLPSHQFTQAIDLGCGTGAITRELIDSCNIEHLHAIDTSISSLTVAHDRLNNENIKIHHMNFDLSLPEYSFDLIFANMALHWSLNLAALVARIDKSLATNGVLAFSIPLDHTFADLVPHFSVNHFLSMNDVNALFNNLNSSLVFAKQETIALQFTDTLSALRYIKRIGASHVTTVRNKEFTGKTALSAIDIRTLTYQIGYFIARKN